MTGGGSAAGGKEALLGAAVRDTAFDASGELAMTPAPKPASAPVNTPVTRACNEKRATLAPVATPLAAPAPVSGGWCPSGGSGGAGSGGT